MSEFARLIRLDTLGSAPRHVEIEADATECGALAARFDLVSIGRLLARADLTREGEAVRATGRLEANVIQSCVATGVELPAALDELFALTFVPAGDVSEELELDEQALDTLSYEGSAVDLGEAVAQTLVLALDPFPRARDADEALRRAGVRGEGESGPFAALKGLSGLR